MFGVGFLSMLRCPTQFSIEDSRRMPWLSRMTSNVGHISVNTIEPGMSDIKSGC
jgi:hypothetical protein